MTIHTLSFDKERIDARQWRNALGRFATGVTVITTRAPDGKLEGLTANSFAAVSLNPPLVLWSLNRSAPSLTNFLASGTFAINILSASQPHLSHHFATPSKDKYENVAFEAGLGGCPILEAPLASFECTTERTLDGGDHIIFIGRVHRATYRDGEPLVFSAGRYCTPSPLPEQGADSDLAAMWDGLG